MSTKKKGSGSGLLGGEKFPPPGWVLEATAGYDDPDTYPEPQPELIAPAPASSSSSISGTLFGGIGVGVLLATIFFAIYLRGITTASYNMQDLHDGKYIVCQSQEGPEARPNVCGDVEEYGRALSDFKRRHIVEHNAFADCQQLGMVTNSDTGQVAVAYACPLADGSFHPSQQELMNPTQVH